MGRFLITNNINIFTFNHEINISEGFSRFDINRIDELHIAVYSKKNIKSCNYYKSSNSGYIFTTGSIIYKDSRLNETLKDIYRDFDGNIEKIQINSFGSYCIFIYKEGKAYLFTDKFNYYNVYFFNTNNLYISNSLANAAIYIDSLEIEEFNLIENSLLLEVIGDETIFKNIKRLYGNQHIVYEQKKMFINNHLWKVNKYNYSGRSIDELINEFSKKVSQYAQKIRSVYGENIILQQTGGLDSRSIQAAFMSTGKVLDHTYGIGNSLITNTLTNDYEYNIAFQKRYHTKFQILNWKSDISNDVKSWSDSFKRYGFFFVKYGGSKEFFNEYATNKIDYPKMILLGDLGENLKLREWASKQPSNTFTISFIFDDYYQKRLSINNKCYTNYEKFRERYINKLNLYSKLFGLNPETGISVQDFDLFRHIHAKESDSLYSNLINEFTHSILFFGIPELLEFLWSIPYEYRRNSRFQILLIKKLQEELLEIPIFSHCQEKIIKPDYSIESTNKDVVKVFEKVKRKSPSLFKAFAKIYRYFYPKEQDRLKKKMEQLLNNSLLDLNILDTKHFGSDTKRLVIYTQYLYGIKIIKFIRQNGSIKIN